MGLRSLEVFYEKLLKVFYCSETSASLAVHSRSYSSVFNVFTASQVKFLLETVGPQNTVSLLKNQLLSNIRE